MSYAGSIGGSKALQLTRKALAYLLVVLMGLSGSYTLPLNFAADTIQVLPSEGGTITVDQTAAEPGEMITGTIAAEPGYEIGTVGVETAAGWTPAQLSSDEATFCFEMPEGTPGQTVKVTAHYMSTTAWDGSVDISWYDPAADTYSIGTPAELAGLAALVNGRTDADTPASMIKGDTSYLKSKATEGVMLVGAGGGNVSDTVYTSEIDFAYKTVYLTADINMGGVCSGGVWKGPNYTPIGGKFSMDTDMVNGDSYVIDTRFNGVFDGQGHTVSNIYCQRYSDKGFPYSMAVGLVGFLGGKSDVSGGTSDFEKGWQPTVRNVVVGDGYIRGRRMVGGVVGRIGETSNGIVIENCANYADICNTDAKGVGGILGSGGADGIIRNCYNVGSVSTTYSCPAGGIIGANGGIDIYNCYNAGTIDSNGATRGRGIGGHDTGVYTVANCYTLTGCDDDPDSKGYYAGSSQRISVNVTQMTAAEMKSNTLLNALNINGTAFVIEKSKNSGYPILYFEASGYTGGADCRISVKQASGGTIAVTTGDTAASGQVVNLKSTPNAGFKLDYFTVNGKKITGAFFLASGDAEVSGVFKKIQSATLNLPSSADYTLVVTATGTVVENGATKNVKNYPVYNGAQIAEDTVILVRAGIRSGARPADTTKEYTGTFHYSATNVTNLAPGKFTVTGAGAVTVTVTPLTKETSSLSAADTSWYEAKKVTYTINTYQELAGLAQLVNKDKLNFAGKTINLGSDISLAGDGRLWDPIGNSALSSFAGTFDGQNHVIGGMTCNTGTGSYCGLFGCCKGATIKNLTVRGTSANNAGMAYACGIAANASGCTIENCISRVDVKTDGYYAGGIAAGVSGGTVIKDCQNYGSISGGTGVGGIAGVCEDTADTISNCVNFGAVTGTEKGMSGVGGIAGKTVGKITDSINAGDVSGNDRYTGGVLGYSSGRKTSTLTGCQNAGKVTSESDNENAGLGGVIGYAQFGTYTSCSNTGKVSAGSGFKTSNIGGFIGRIGNEPALNTATGCTYLTSSASSAAAGGTYTGVTSETSIPALSYTEVPDPGDPTGSTGSTGSVQTGASTESREEICGGITLSGSGTYYLMAYAAGELNIPAGASVTLVGTGKTLGALTLRAGEGASVTLQDVNFTGDETLLTYTGSGKLILKGSSSLIGTCDESDNQKPTISAGGNLTVGGTGIVLVQSAKANAAVKINPGKTLTVNGGILSVYKTELLGEAGGAIYANGGTVNITGGSIVGRTTSDNVSVISANTVNISGGSVNLKAEKSPKTIDASTVNVSGGKIKAYGHSGNSAKEVKEYYGTSSIPNIKGSPSLYQGAGAFQSAVPSRQNIVVDGAVVEMEVYNIDGSNYFKLRDVAALMSGTKSEFSVDFSSPMTAMYTEKGSTYKSAGGELVTGTDKSSTCTPSSWLLYVNGNLVNCSVYNIGGNNFFKLRDMSTAFGIGVSFDKATNTASISS